MQLDEYRDSDLPGLMQMFPKQFTLMNSEWTPEAVELVRDMQERVNRTEPFSKCRAAVFLAENGSYFHRCIALTRNMDSKEEVPKWVSELPDWLRNREHPPSMQEICENIGVEKPECDDGELLATVPTQDLGMRFAASLRHQHSWVRLQFSQFDKWGPSCGFSLHIGVKPFKRPDATTAYRKRLTAPSPDAEEESEELRFLTGMGPQWRDNGKPHYSGSVQAMRALWRTCADLRKGLVGSYAALKKAVLTATCEDPNNQEYYKVLSHKKRRSLYPSSRRAARKAVEKGHKAHRRLVQAKLVLKIVTAVLNEWPFPKRGKAAYVWRQLKGVQELAEKALK